MSQSTSKVFGLGRSRPRRKPKEFTSKNPSPIDKHVGSRVRLRRMMLPMSQEKLAGKLGITFQQVQKYEKGMNRVSASRLWAISLILKVPVGFFFEGLAGHEALESGGMPVQATDIFVMTRNGQSIAKDFPKIGIPKVQHALTGLISVLANEHSEHAG